jgi:hypothetical protein
VPFATLEGIASNGHTIVSPSTVLISKELDGHQHPGASISGEQNADQLSNRNIACMIWTTH